ncbi:hypothetical protein CC1G_06697 [Coprinopsis cinerea okayama7|uniref:F-box domain-containing protein n=1 Tax=Coprinopsis cinerea (strain Okayama-7 / 130 / ATCC MYA-4618 / FGSC 9003) TaxID=240176 RepID=A8P824_COPC7|nr:hypothetical protein CC1G_06697 [Coprinopsis cinerea okayama7\|eukprot:XP_001839484.2 hypothetical protein CC1G_06697 [Coprinopsis cinerea okayama7\
MGLPPATDLPPEIWILILDFATSYDDGSAALSLCEVSKGFYQLVQPPSVIERVAPASRGIINLRIEIDSLYPLIYPPESLDSEQDEEDTSYVDEEIPSVSGDGDRETSDGGIYLEGGEEAKANATGAIDHGDDECDNASDESEDGDGDTISSTDSDYEYQEVSHSDLDFEHEAQRGPDTEELKTYLSTLPKHGDGTLADLARIPTLLAEAEHTIYSAIRRIVLSSSQTLRIVHMHITAEYFVSITSIFPVLPNLEILDMKKGRSGKVSGCTLTIRKVDTPCPVLFPRLRLAAFDDGFNNDRQLEELTGGCEPEMGDSLVSSEQDWIAAVNGRLG